MTGKKVLCWLGFHDWEWNQQPISVGAVRECRRCGLAEEVIEEVLPPRKWRVKELPRRTGEVLLSGASSIVIRGKRYNIPRKAKGGNDGR